MQFIIVTAQLRGDPTIFFPNVPVLIDGVKNGLTLRHIQLDPGTFEISVDHPNSEVLDVDVEDTTYQEPLHVTVECDRKADTEEHPARETTESTKIPDTKIKYLDLQEFMDYGFLQEANRLFFHPLGLALEVVCDDAGKPVRLGGVWDYRDDPEGMIFGITGRSEDEKWKEGDERRDKELNVEALRHSKITVRKKLKECDSHGIQDWHRTYGRASMASMSSSSDQ